MRVLLLQILVRLHQVSDRFTVLGRDARDVSQLVGAVNALREGHQCGIPTAGEATVTVADDDALTRGRQLLLVLFLGFRLAALEQLHLAKISTRRSTAPPLSFLLPLKLSNYF